MVDIARATCPRCGATISADDPAGLCPRCLASGAQDGQSQDAAVCPSAPQGARRKRWLALAAAVISAILSGGLWLWEAWRRQSDAMAHYSIRLDPTHPGTSVEEIAERRAAIRIMPDGAEAHNNLGRALANQGKLDEAIAEFREAIRLEPTHSAAHFNLGVALANQGKLDEAIAEYREAIRLEPRSAMNHLFLGLALRDQGKRQEAIAELRKAGDKAERGSELAWLIEEKLNELDH